jgi:hypothetical protein
MTVGVAVDLEACGLPFVGVGVGCNRLTLRGGSPMVLGCVSQGRAAR